MNIEEFWIGSLYWESSCLKRNAQMVIFEYSKLSILAQN